MENFKHNNKEVAERLEDTISMICDIYNESYEKAMQSDDRNFRTAINKLEVIKDRLIDFNLEELELLVKS